MIEWFASAMTFFSRRPALAAAAVLMLTALAPAVTTGKPAGRPVYPGATWEAAAADGSPDAVRRREALIARLRTGDTSAMLVVVGGRVAFSYGDVAATSYIASARKSVVALLYGKYVADRTIRLDATLRELGIDDTGGLLPREREATVKDLLAARSGVYHPAANAGDASDRAPARGSVAPGRYFLYNNWDFNALEAILERATGRAIHELVTADLAEPLAFEDWNRTPGAYAAVVRNDTGASNFPAHHLVLSTRDMARIGYLMLRGGRWRDRQVEPAGWIARISRVVTPAAEVATTSPFQPGLAYGNLWWILDGPPFRGTPLEGAYTASGAYGQFITVVPRLDLVVAHKTVAPSERNVPADVYLTKILPAAAALAER
jgi:CubicO group peptidase (beta-lactamase class C family)